MTDKRKQQLNSLEERMGYCFNDKALLDAALTHSSYVKGDCKGQEHNERLEYLGDAVLELCISDKLYSRYPDWPEGGLTRARAGIVCEASLNSLARSKLSLQEYLHLGNGEEYCGGRNKPSIVSDALEAVIGAVYLDGGIEAARDFILRLAEEEINGAKSRSRDYKSALQEYVQRRHMGLVAYKLKSAHGPDHKKEFIMQALLGGEVVGEGVGASKQEAGQRAARAAMLSIKNMKEE